MTSCARLQGRTIPAAVFVLAVVFTVILGAVGATDTAAKPKADVYIVSEEKRHHFRLEIARTPKEMERGLMFRTSLPEDGGMLFDLGGMRVMTMWMMNTLISLDMLFVAADGRIVKIAPRRQPRSRRIVSSGDPVRAVIELPGGTAARLGIAVGARAEHALFKGGGS